MAAPSFSMACGFFGSGSLTCPPPSACEDCTASQDNVSLAGATGILFCTQFNGCYTYHSLCIPGEGPDSCIWIWRCLLCGGGSSTRYFHVRFLQQAQTFSARVTQSVPEYGLAPVSPGPGPCLPTSAKGGWLDVTLYVSCNSITGKLVFSAPLVLPGIIGATCSGAGTITATMAGC
jgi:hypothetical protein